MANCPLCSASAGSYVSVDDVRYFECSGCDFIFADPVLIARVDAGEPLRNYDEDYWSAELESARARAYGSSLARASEAILYCRIPIKRFIDIGTGPGFLLDALSIYLPASRNIFHGVEKFPPAAEMQSNHENYFRGDLSNVGLKFECGVCVELLEHLSAEMARNLARAMAAVSVQGSLYVFNTGLTDYVRREDPGYLDPYKRGHITCWSVTAARRIFEPAGFAVHSLHGKTWAFAVEYGGVPSEDAEKFRNRIWSVVPENQAILSDPRMGSVLFILGRESARAY